MKEILVRSFSGLLYILLLLISLKFQYATIILFFVFGMICILELNRLLQLKSSIPYIIFIVLYIGFGVLHVLLHSKIAIDNATQGLMVLSIFVELFLIKDLFSTKTNTLFNRNRFIITTFYLSSAFVFLILTTYYNQVYNPHILLGTFILVWTNDTFAFVIGKKFGKQKLFEKISPKKTVEGFLGGLLFASIGSYFIATFMQILSFTNWLILGIIISVFGTLGDLIESKFKRQANVKDSGAIMPGHGGLLDRLDSIIFAAPFIYLFLRILQYVS